MDAITVTAITAGISTLVTEVIKGTAGEAGKDTWNKMKQLLGSRQSESIGAAVTALATELEQHPETAKALLELLKSSDSSNIHQLVGHIDAEKVIFSAGTITGDIHM